MKRRLKTQLYRVLDDTASPPGSNAIRVTLSTPVPLVRILVPGILGAIHQEPAKPCRVRVRAKDVIVQTLALVRVIVRRSETELGNQGRRQTEKQDDKIMGHA